MMVTFHTFQISKKLAFHCSTCPYLYERLQTLTKRIKKEMSTMNINNLKICFENYKSITIVPYKTFLYTCIHFINMKAIRPKICPYFLQINLCPANFQSCN